MYKIGTYLTVYRCVYVYTFIYVIYILYIYYFMAYNMIQYILCILQIEKHVKQQTLKATGHNIMKAYLQAEKEKVWRII